MWHRSNFPFYHCVSLASGHTSTRSDKEPVRYECLAEICRIFSDPKGGSYKRYCSILLLAVQSVIWSGPPGEPLKIGFILSSETHTLWNSRVGPFRCSGCTNYRSRFPPSSNRSFSAVFFSK